jgi:phosphoglycolate phosphatase
MTRATVRGVVFDLDGTLIDSYLDISNALNEVLTRLGRAAVDPESVKTMIGSGVSALLKRALAGDRPEVLEEAKKHFRGAYEARLTDRTRPYPGVLEAIRALDQRGLAVMIATNKPSYYTDRIVRALGLEQAGVSAWASADEVRHRKPSPDLVQLALERGARAKGSAPLAAAEIAYVGDMPIDVETARAVGCRMVGVAWGFDPAGLRARLTEATDELVERPEALVDLIAKGEE